MSSFQASTKEYVGGPNGKRMLLVRGALTLGAGEGGTSGDIPASLFGLSKIYSVTPAIKGDDSEIALFAISADGTELFAADLKQATDADRGDPADLEGAWTLTVIGS